MKLKISALMLSFILVTAIISCTNSDIENSDISYPNMSELANQIMTNCSFPEMFELDNAYISGEYGVDPEMLDDVFAAVPSEYPGIERIFLGVVSESASAEAAKDALSKTLDTVKAEYVEYIPSEYEKAKHTEIYSNGRFVALIITEDYNEAINTVENNIK